MLTTVTRSSFRDAFQSIRPDQFSYEGLGVLFDMLEQYEQDTGENVLLDVIALCCDFAEHTWQDIAADYYIDADSADDVEEYLQENAGLFASVGCESFVYQKI